MITHEHQAAQDLDEVQHSFEEGEELTLENLLSYLKELIASQDDDVIEDFFERSYWMIRVFNASKKAKPNE